MRLGPSLWIIPTVLQLVGLVLGQQQQHSSQSSSSPTRRAFRELNSSALDALTAPDPELEGFLDPSVDGGGLKTILIPRVAGTDNNVFVQKYLTDVFKGLEWDVETDRFTDSTPYGDREFTNLIFTFDKDAPRRIVLAAHFDSKFFPTAPNNEFVGATDSAFPVTMLCSLATTLTPLLRARQVRLQTASDSGEWIDVGEDGFDEMEAGETTLQLVFFDGEEAFKYWTDQDSTYGARHLAQKWEDAPLTPPESDSYHYDSRHRFAHQSNVLSSIDALVLLDLLGAANPSLSSFYPSTGGLYDQLIDVEARLGKAGKFRGLGETSWEGDKEGGKGKSWFAERKGKTWVGGGISDDHLPFLQRGVEILHLIASPFPAVWHTIRDDASALHVPTCKRWDLLMKVWTAEYLGLMPSSGEKAKRRRVESTRPTATTGSKRVERSGDLAVEWSIAGPPYLLEPIL